MVAVAPRCTRLRAGCVIYRKTDFPKGPQADDLRPFSFWRSMEAEGRERNEMLQPSENEFEQLAPKGFNLIPVFEEIAADLETPVSAFLKIARGDYSFLLESVRGGEKWGRYTFLGTEPALVIRARGTRMDLIRPGHATESRHIDDAFEALRHEVQRFRAPEIPGMPR